MSEEGDDGDNHCHEGEEEADEDEDASGQKPSSALTQSHVTSQMSSSSRESSVGGGRKEDGGVPFIPEITPQEAELIKQ